MQGRGVIQYDSNKTSHAISTATSQFDDELMKRNIVTAEQVYLAKGAKSLEEAHRLANERLEQRKGQPPQVYDISSQRDQQDREENDDDDDDEYDDLLDDNIGDDPFFARYRQERLIQLKQESAKEAAIKESFQQHNMPTRIQREEWTARVNEASHQNWVLVILWDDSSMRTQDILQDLERLQREREHSDVHVQEEEEEDDSEDEIHSPKASNVIKIVTIEYQQANPHWPSKRVPAIFAYRNGTKQHEWVTHQAGKFPTREQLQLMLLEWGI